MMGFGKLAVLTAALALLGACEFTDNAVKPSVTGTPNATADAAKGPQPAQPVGVIRNSAGSVTVPPLDNSKPDQPTGTAVGQKVQELKGDLVRLQDTIKAQSAKQQTLHSDIEQNAAAYQAITGAI